MKILLIILLIVIAFTAYTLWQSKQPVDQQKIIDQAYEQAAEYKDIKSIQDHK